MLKAFWSKEPPYRDTTVGRAILWQVCPRRHAL